MLEHDLQLLGADRAELAATRQYDKKSLLPLQRQVLTRFDDNSHLVRVQRGEVEIMDLAGLRRIYA